MEPYTALQLEGRDIYVREGCYVCHSQMIRPFRSETERYGHYSLAGESVYDRPIYAVYWGVVYLGFSLLAFASWGFPPETTLQRAERLTSNGRYADALTVVNQALEERPGDQDAYELQQTLRDLMRYA